GGTGRPYYTYINTTSGNSTWPIASQSVPINQYFSVAFTHDYATGQFRGYLNGDLKSYGILPTTPLQNDENVLIGLGRFISVADRYFVGAIDEIRIYNRVLSETEIEALYFLR
ncbi:MAG: LamG domain-containing protein, partial [Candidatus Aminicenantes bacterium]